MPNRTESARRAPEPGLLPWFATPAPARLSLLAHFQGDPHDGIRPTAMPSMRHDRPEGFTSRIERYEPNRGPGGWYGKSDWHTERITGFHEGNPVASIDYHVHPQGHALKVDKMDSFARGRGHASALMDDLLAAHPHALINMGHYTPDGSAWRAQYHHPEPERDIHHLADQPHLWDQHFDPHEVDTDMQRNRQTNRHHGRPDQHLPPIDEADEDEFEAGGLTCDGPCTRCQEIQHRKDHPPVEEPEEEAARPQPVPEVHDPKVTGWHADHRIKLNAEDTAFVHDRRNPTSERAQRLLQAIGPANLPTQWHPSAQESARHRDQLPVQVHDPDTFETRVRLHSAPGSEPTHVDDVMWRGKNPILHGGFHRFPEGERPALPGGLRHTASAGPTWFHGTAGDFDKPTVDEDAEREKVGDHWNLPLGTHWTSSHEVADRIARTAPNKPRFGDPLADRLGGQPRVFHARLDMANPKIFLSEHDMAREAYGHEYDAGNHPSIHDPHHLRFFADDPVLGHENDLRDAADARADEHTAGNMGRYDTWLSAHPDRYAIAKRYQRRLIDAGHDGIIYGNEYEGRRPDGRQEPQIPHLHPCAIAFHPDQVHIQAVHHPDAGCDHTPHTASSKPWMPHDRYFGPGHPDLDPRLFDGEHLKPSWRRALLRLVDKAFTGYRADWRKWARVYLAGSQASHWYGNDDLDLLIGIDYTAFRRALPRYNGLTEAAIDDMLNAEAHRMCDPARWFTIGGEHLGPFDSTLYVNHGSYDIRKIKPYAAYDLTGDRWAVKPVEVPADFSAESLPSADFLYARSLASQVRALKKLPAGQAQALGSALYDRLHGERHDAFSGHGGGLYDVRNVAWKYLALHPEHPMEQLVAWKRAETPDTKTASAMAERACDCCDGSGEHLNGHECTFCDASGDGSDTSGPVPCQGALAEVAPVRYRDGEYRSTCPCGTPVHFDDGNGWRHADTSYSHDDGECVSDKMRAIASPGFGAQLKRTAAFEHVTLPNPEAAHPANGHARHDEWFHASRHPFDHPGDFADDDTFDSEDGAEESQGAHWNTGLGVHWTSRHDVANSIARNRGHDLSYRDENFDDAKAPVGAHETPRVFHGKLHIKNPKVYASEHDMDREAYAHEYEDGNFPSEHDGYDDHDDILNHEEDLRTTQQHLPDRFAHWITHHPDRHGITYRFQQRLQDAGHDGIIYGNEVETAGQRANRHPSAIVFHPGQAEITQVHRVWEPCLHGQKLDDFRYPRPGQEALPGTGPGLEHLGLKGPGSDADFAKNSAMVALVPPRSLADKLVQKDGEPADQMHVTLAYIPDVGPDRGAVHRAVTAWACRQQPIRCRVQGAGTFVTAPPSPHVEHALIDVHRGSDLHSGLLAHLEGAGLTPARDHGFTAHITLAYRKHHVRFLPKITPEEFTAHHVYVCHGDDWQPVPLGGATAVAAGAK